MTTKTMYFITKIPRPPFLTMSLRLLLFFLSLLPVSLSQIFNYSLHIDSGSLANVTDTLGTVWLSDRFFTGGSTAVVSEPLRFLHPQEKTLRYFPIASGKKNCYTIVPFASTSANTNPNRFFLRTFTVYDNYDGKSHTPSFDVSVEGTLVFSWRSPWPEAVSRSGSYSDLFFYQTASTAGDDNSVDLCFYSIATDAPVIGSLELYQIDPKAYTFTDGKINGTSTNYVLVNYGRFSAGSDQWGPGFTNDSDIFGRSWQSDTEFRATIGSSASIKAVSSVKPVKNADVGPNYFPEKLYERAVLVASNGGGDGGGALEYELPVDAKLDYLLWFHFAEIDLSVNKAGQRVFDVMVNGENVNRVDVFDKVGGFSAYDWSYVVKNLSNTILNVRLESVVGSPILCGLENYAIVPMDLRTLPEQVAAMKSLKASLRVPDRMGWNGDPCAPTTWDAWEGVTCHPNKDESALVISQIDLGRQGLKGYISDQISLLTNLVSLNLSSNSLTGTIPSGLGQQSLVKLDLSNNRLTGYLPDSLTSSTLQLVLLNGNLLQGQVPEELYSIGVHGGIINLTGNKGLCGVPSLPNCPLFWGKHGLSTGGKVAIALSVLVILALLVLCVYYFCVWRRRYDYDFGLPHELVSLAAKRNRYQRQKSLMTLEMESQHAKGFIPTYNVS